MSDIVLKTLNADGKELHASKHTLATHSPFFQAMFFGADWKEKSSDSLKLDDDYEVVKEVLRILYQLDRTYMIVRSPDDLFQLYIFADKYDVPLIRDMCKAELVTQPGLASLGSSVRLGLHETSRKILGSVDFATITTFFDSIVGEGVICDGEEVKLILKKAKEHHESLLSKEKAKAENALTELKERCVQLESSDARILLYECTPCGHTFRSRSPHFCPKCQRVLVMFKA